MAKFLISSILILNGFSFRIFIILSFDAVWPQRTWPQKGLREFFQKLHFWNQCIPRKKIRYVIASWSTFSLNLFSEEVWNTIRCTTIFCITYLDCINTNHQFDSSSEMLNWFCRKIELYSMYELPFAVHVRYVYCMYKYIKDFFLRDKKHFCILYSMYFE